tara:strand:+ start:599 stop:766 length:168 start_codon:yes stop_codon:yes gene_type:complete
MPYFTKMMMPTSNFFAKKPAMTNRVFAKGTNFKPIIPSMMRKQIIGSNGMGIRKM